MSKKNYLFACTLLAALGTPTSSLAPNMPPMDLSSRKHTSNFSARKNHPASYEDSPRFLGPLILPKTKSTSDNRTRIKHFYADASNGYDLTRLEQAGELKPLPPSACTDLILKTITDHFAMKDAPVDAKEMAESMEFYLRTKKRLMGAAKKRHAKNLRLSNKNEQNSEEKNELVDDQKVIVEVYDLCSGHGLTGMLFAACNPPRQDRIVKAHLVDIVQPPSHQVLKELIAEVCPWVNDNVQFHTSDLDSFDPMTMSNTETNKNSNTQDVCPIVIATHACGTLTDKVLEQAVKMECCAIAAMPCCYTGTDKGVPYGIKRAHGVAWAADIKRTYFLDSHHFHTDYSTIPLEITPLNRIIVAEDRS